MANFLPGIPILASSFVTVGISGTGFKNALSTSMISPSTDKSFTISPEGFISATSSGVKGLLLLHPASAAPANKLAAKNSLLELSFVFIKILF